MLAAVLLCCGACSDDKDEVSVDRAKLIGSWLETREYDGENDKWYSFDDGTEVTYVFREDGTGEIEVREGATKGYTEEFTFAVQGNRVRMDYDGSDFENPYVETLTDTELVLAGDYLGEDGKKYTDKACFVRVE